MSLTQSRVWSVLLTAYGTTFIAAFYLPLVIVFVLSFGSIGAMSFPLGSLTTRWYGEVANDPEFAKALFNSFSVGAISASLSTAMAVTISLGLRHKSHLNRFMLALVLLPMLLPGVVGGAVLFVFYNFLGIEGNRWVTVLPAHVLYILPFAFLTIYPRIRQLEITHEEAASDLGATRLMVFTRMIWPSIRAAVFSTLLFSFTLSFDEFIRTLFVTGYDRTVPVMFWTSVTEKSTPHLPAMAVVIMAISVVMSVASLVIGNRNKTGSSIH